MRQRTLQPEAYLKEVLAEIGVLVKRGPYVGCWTLLEIYKTPGQKAAGAAKIEEAAAGAGGVKDEVVEPADGSDASDGSDEDMEEV